MELGQDSLYFFIIIFGGALTQGFTGFGFSLICLPVLFLIFDPKLIIFLTVLPGCFTAITNFIFMRGSVPWKEISGFFSWLVVGVVVGGIAFPYIPVVVVKTLLWLMLCYSLGSRTIFGKNAFLSNSTFCGLSAGIGQGTIGAPGPAAVSYALSQDWAEHKKKSALAAILCFSCLLRLGIYLTLPEMHHLSIWIYGSICIPIIFVGIFIGQKIGKKLSEPMMKKAIDIFLVIFIVTLGFEIIKSLF